MDPAPRDVADLPLDPELGVPVPFACGTAGTFGGGTGEQPSARTLDHRRVTQCALSRVCGVCGASLGRPVAFLGTRAEVGRNAFHFPGSHLACVQALQTAYAGVPAALLGQEEPVEEWQVVTTAAFEFVRAGRDAVDRRATFEPGAPV
ncbi:hypothetical protein [Nocardioides sp.]|uniref:hypothetical protein n=1 Tax=Nocardioides sp. TaxID=35761 RepID=UPI0027331849|nr:hypothetical protein [Nocardioides sp.]MDP3891905.1 hypothetical protein [Nocardioides sp.]